MELANIHPRPPALRLFDAGMGDGTVLARTMRAMHNRFPTMPFYIVGKEISLEDVRLVLEKMPDRLFEHPATVLVMTNMYYSEAPWLKPNSVNAATSLVWHEVSLTGNTAHEFETQITDLGPFLADHWRARMSRASGNPVYEKPVVLVIYREDHRFLLDQVRPRRGFTDAEYDLVIASQPYRARAPLEFKARRVVAPLARALAPGGRLIAIHSHGNDPGLEIIQRIWPGENPFTTRSPRSAACDQGGTRQRRPRPEFWRVRRCTFAVPLRHAHAAERDQRHDRHFDTVRRVECRGLCRADRGPAAVRGDQQRCLSRRDQGGAARARRAVVLGRVLRDLAQAGFRLMDAAPLTTTQHQRVAALIGNCSIELSPRDELAGEALRRLLDPGTSVFVNHPPSVTHHDIVAACARLRRAGFVPVPHVAARRLASFTQASDFLQRAAGEATVDRILLIGGDDSPVGPFRASLDLLATGLIERHSIGNVAFGGYPEGHPSIDARTLDTALQAKVALAQQRGLAVSLVTQFGFEAQPILRWIAALRARGINCPVHVGVAGPASVATLAKFADPLWHRRVAPRTGARPYGIRTHPRRGHARRPDRRTGGRRGRAGADRRSACLHLWRRAPYRGVASHKRLNCDPRAEQNRNFGEPSLPWLRRISATNPRNGNRVSFLFSNVSPADISAPWGGGERCSGPYSFFWRWQPAAPRHRPAT